MHMSCGAGVPPAWKKAASRLPGKKAGSLLPSTIAVPSADRQNVQILLVEDDPDDVWVDAQPAGRPLGRAVPVDPRRTPFRRAPAASSKSPFDIVLLDLSLPDSQGLETFFAMHANAARRADRSAFGLQRRIGRGEGRAGRARILVKGKWTTICWSALSATR